MKADAHMISGVIQNGYILRIPYFQRSYVWNEKDWERFADDMESTLTCNSKYFLGAIILKEEAKQEGDSQKGIGQRYMVIDGQQRLTTLCIYMKVLYTLANEMGDFNRQYLRKDDIKSPVIEHSREDRTRFCDVMHLEAMRTIDNDEHNIVKAYNYFLNRLLPHRDKLNILINTITSQIKFVVIILDGEDDEQQIFDTINSLGVPLTTCDLVKNFLYGPNDQQAYEENWRRVFESTKDIREFWNTDASKSRQEKTKDNSVVERFFHAFVRIKMWDFKEQLTEVQKKDFVKMSNVFSTCKAFHEIFGISKQDLANQIIEYAELFKRYLGDEVLDDENIPRHSDIKRISCFINATKNYSVIPYVLYVLHDVDDIDERNRIFTYLESYLVRRILSESNNNDYSGLFAESLIGNRITTANALQEYIRSKDADANLAMPSNANIKLSVSTRKKGLGETLAQTIFYLYETKLNSIGKSYNDFYVQMLMPKSKNANITNWPQENNPRKEKDREMLITTIGNYFLLNIAGKKSLKKKIDESCTEKVDEMIRWSDSVRSNQILSNPVTKTSIQEWNTESIKKRNSSLATIFCDDIWKA